MHARAAFPWTLLSASADAEDVNLVQGRELSHDEHQQRDQDEAEQPPPRAPCMAPAAALAASPYLNIC
jgi:hypothetical protein